MQWKVIFRQSLERHCHTDVELVGVQGMQSLAQACGRHYQPAAAALLVRLKGGKQVRQSPHHRIPLKFNPAYHAPQLITITSNYILTGRLHLKYWLW